MSEKFLDSVYAARTPQETQSLYDAWAKSYEAEVTENGYVTPGRCAAALATFVSDTATPILDFGCGTGLSGAALAAQGFSTIDGTDLSDGMLATARDRGVYRSLSRNDPGASLEAYKHEYSIIAAIGVISPGAGPVTLLTDLLDLLPKSGLIVFSFNDHALEDPTYEALVDRLTSEGQVRQLFRDYGDHLPGRDMKSLVYILEKL